MKKGFILLAILWWSYCPAQDVQKGDTVLKRPCVFKTNPPYLDTVTHKLVLRNQQAPFGRKFIRATGLILAMETCEMTVLLVSPTGFSQWNHSQQLDLRIHYKTTFTQPPVIDKDSWEINYIGHPFQGAFNYNALRSQGAPIWQSALFATLHSTLWEYVIEGSEERPSIQDLIVTPIAGALLGELIHFATMKMSRSGFTWYEGLFVCILNPAFVLNNGFKFANPKSYKRNLK